MKTLAETKEKLKPHAEVTTEETSLKDKKPDQIIIIKNDGKLAIIKPTGKQIIADVQYDLYEEGDIFESMEDFIWSI